MKKMLIIYYLVLLSSCLSSQDIILEMLVDTDDTNRPLGYSAELSEYIPYTEERNVIYHISPSGKQPVHTIDERFYIFHMDYNPDNNKILYMFGYAEMIFPAIYDLTEGKETILENVVKDGHDNLYYPTFGNAYWLDETSIIYHVVNPEKGKYEEIRIHNLLDDKSFTLIEDKDLVIFHFNKKEKIIVFKNFLDEMEGLNIFDIETKEYLLLNERKYSYIIAISNDKYIGFSKEDYPSIVTFVNNGDVVHTNSQYDSIGPVFYDSQSGKLIAQVYVETTGGKDIKHGIFQIKF